MACPSSSLTEFQRFPEHSSQRHSLKLSVRFSEQERQSEALRLVPSEGFSFALSYRSRTRTGSMSVDQCNCRIRSLEAARPAHTLCNYPTGNRVPKSKTSLIAT